jgi:hypothetical protein
MNVRSARTARLALALLAVAQADAGFQTAFSEYNAGHYDAAHAQFLALAELGDYRGGRTWQGELFAPAPAGVP